jgi:two-component system, chemotaxis family, response regulator Rcp1
MKENARKNLKVLLVEDNAMDAILNRELLAESERNIYEVMSVADGVEALELVKSTNGSSCRPDLIILDLNLPKMSGFDFLGAIRRSERLRSIPVFVLTTSSDREDKEKAKQLDVQHFFVKPLDLEEFEQRLEAAARL